MNKHNKPKELVTLKLMKDPIKKHNRTFVWLQVEAAQTVDRVCRNSNLQMQNVRVNVFQM